jgi:PTH1 family peptidyl-tRNA hydrolase
MKYIIGLGNPGLAYGATKHNIGASAVKQLAKENGIRLKEKRYCSLSGKGTVAGKAVTLVLPQTYMNRSGGAVEDIVRLGADASSDIIVVCDDINLKLGRVRMKKHGSAGGQKGLESIIASLGTDVFPRLRIGIATETHSGDITRYVLTPFKRHERRPVRRVLDLAVGALECWAGEGIDIAMTKFNIKKAATS